MFRILGVHIANRNEQVTAVQSCLTEFGCNIRTRLGLHDAGACGCSKDGLIVLELVGDTNQCETLVTSLKKLPGVSVQEMKF